MEVPPVQGNPTVHVVSEVVWRGGKALYGAHRQSTDIAPIVAKDPCRGGTQKIGAVGGGGAMMRIKIT